jgi:hypothetical protein
MDIYIFIAILTALINIVLSLTIPCLLRNNNQPFFKEMNKLFTIHKELILTSSLIVAITVYLALNTGPEINNLLSSYTQFNLDNDENVNIKVINLDNLNRLNSFNNLDNFKNYSSYNNLYRF